MNELITLLDNLIDLTKYGKIKWRADDDYDPKKFFLSTPSFRIIFLAHNKSPHQFVVHDEEGNIVEDISMIGRLDTNVRGRFVALMREITQKIAEKRKLSLNKLIEEVVQLGNK